MSASECKAQQDDSAHPAAVSFPAVLTREDAIRWALQYNPELAAIRQQRGIAAAAVVIAETYPFNPAWEGKVEGTSGPASAGITNSVALEHRVSIDIELHHQGRYRRQGAYAGLARTDWEIAFQEQAMAIRTARAFNAVVYRQRKLELLDETVALTQQTLQDATRLWKASKLARADVILAESDADDARAAVGPGRTALATAQYDLRRVLGVLDQPFEVRGSLEIPPQDWSQEDLLQSAREQRADFRGRQAAVAEAQARLDLETRNRWGNPNVGPIYALDPTNVSSSGVIFVIPLSVVNTHTGEIQQRKAERVRAALDLRQVEYALELDVLAALKRMREARSWLERYEKEVLPHLRKSLKEMRSLFENNQVDVLRVISVQRSLIRARDAYLDALLEMSQAQTDLAAAVGNPAVALATAPPIK
jgi:outer membrane protein TolC